MIHSRRVLSATSLLFFPLFTGPSSVASQQSALPVIAANDNRMAAGELKDGRLTLRLELRKARWYPDRDTDPSIELHAFGEVGQAPQIPGPLIRVPEGTEIKASVRNQLPRTVWIHGLHEHPGNPMDSMEVAAGATREVRFKAGSAGTFTYWATTSSNAPLEKRLTDDTQLSGAFVVDRPGEVVGDRIFVLGLWLPDPTLLRNNVASVNGKSWPYTERLLMRAGETALWRVINGSIDDHAMHLHGFHFRVDSLGDGETDKPYAPDARPLAVTQHLPPGATMALSWTPKRAGNWLFHCHMLIHMSPHMAIPSGTQKTDHIENDAAAGMGGLVLGIQITGETAKVPAATTNIRHLRLILRQRRGGVPLFGFELQEPGSAEPKGDAPVPLVGPPIVLTRGQAAEIEVVNTSNDLTAIHWHGMELESFYDGVPGYTGDSRQTTPAIMPGESFVAKMTPPHAGTYIYHTHWHDDQQIVNGVYGPLIVLEPGQTYDPDHDKVFLFSLGKFPDPLGTSLLLNGSPQPFQVRLRAGEKYRLRLINITANSPDIQVSLAEAGRTVHWKNLAKDGIDLPAPLAVVDSARQILTVGETRDFEYQSGSPTELQLEGLLPSSRRRVVLALVFEKGK